MDKSTGWEQTISASQLRRTDIWTAINSTTINILENLLLETTLTEKECNKIQFKILSAAFPASWIPRTLRAVVYGPKEDGGLGFQRLYITLGVEHDLNIVELNMEIATS